MTRAMRRWLAVVLLGLAVEARADEPRFPIAEAIRAEWARQPIPLTEAARAALPAADRARLLLAERRIGAPGAEALLPPELEKPELAAWEERAKAARSHQERFTALFFLNRLKSAHALSALDGLTADDARGWPRHLHLEAQVATARLRGEEPGPALRAFLAALPVDPVSGPVRAQAAQLRLVAGGKEASLPPPLEPTPVAVLALLDAWARTPPDRARAEAHLELLKLLLGKAAPAGGRPPLGPEGREQRRAVAGEQRALEEPLRRRWSSLGLRDEPFGGVLGANRAAAIVRLLEGLPALRKGGASDEWAFEAVALASTALTYGVGVAAADEAFWSRAAWGAAEAFGRALYTEPGASEVVRTAAWVALRPGASKARGGEGKPRDHADRPASIRAEPGPPATSDPIARGYAIGWIAEAPPYLDELARQVFTDREVDSLQALIEAFDRWKLPPERRRALLAPFLEHPTWVARLEAWKALRALDPPTGPATPWPRAVPPTPEEERILAEAIRLAEAGRPVRLRITFDKKRTIVLKLDPVTAPVNVANLALLARRGFFDGHRVPRVVPDFVVQLGSPLDTMDGGPGYAVRCEDSLAWYGPGSVGMALSGKDTGGSQLFITLNAVPHLTGRYTRVGEVEDLDRAMPILDALELGARIERVEVLP